MMHAGSPPTIVERGRATSLVWLGGAIGVACAALLFFFNPAEHAFYPRCFMKMATGLDCPGCGGLRAAHQLFHGNVREAFALNPLLVAALPFILFFGGRYLLEQFTGKKFSRRLRPATALWICAAVVISFGVLRNLPWRAWLD